MKSVIDTPGCTSAVRAVRCCDVQDGRVWIDLVEVK